MTSDKNDRGVSSEHNPVLFFKHRGKPQKFAAMIFHGSSGIQRAYLSKEGQAS